MWVKMINCESTLPGWPLSCLDIKEMYSTVSCYNSYNYFLIAKINRNLYTVEPSNMDTVDTKIFVLIMEVSLHTV